MKLIETTPQNSKIKKYVDRYQYFEFPGPSFLKTIPNGKFDCWTAIDGYFEIWDFDKDRFIEVGSAGIIPATNRVSLLKISSHLTCLNIKMNLSVMGLSIMNAYPHNILKQNVASFLNKSTQEIIISKQFLLNNEPSVNALDELMLPYLQDKEENQITYSLLNYLRNNTQASVSNLANQMNMTPKSLERLIKRLFGLTPIELFNIFRFEKTTAYLQKNEAARLIDALDFGYYDQSHFIKTCKKITGTTPKELLRKMKLPTNDLLID
ncbi:MAG: helix-turn-helix domain-containing protein [Fulvivirga sp.]